MGRPETKFVSVGRDRVAYVVWGEGPTDVLFLAQFGASVDAIWEHPGHLRWSRSLGARLRVIMLDHRGSGMSDSVPEARQGNLDDRIDDVLAVLDAVGVERVSVCAEGDGAMTAIKFAVEHPERVDKLVLQNGYAAGWVNRPGELGGSVPWKRGWSHASRTGAWEADHASVFGSGEGPGGAVGASAPRRGRV